jgi:predicted phosphodiesterase
VRILATADLHYRLPHYDWLVEQAAEFDVIAVPGDHIDLASSVPPAAQMVVLGRYFERLAGASTFFTTSGNHDLDGPDAHGEQVPTWLRSLGERGVHVDGHCVDVGDTRFSLCPWWDGPHANAAVEEQLARDADGRPLRWVWLYHSPPPGPLCRTGRREFPDADLARWIERFGPDLVFTGHIHQAPWVEGGGWAQQVGGTWVFNAGRTSGPIPAHVIVDTDTGTAEWWAPPDSGGIALWS